MSVKLLSIWFISQHEFVQENSKIWKNEFIHISIYYRRGLQKLELVNGFEPSVFRIVGMAGIWESLLLVAFCGLCTFLTGISLSAIATNGAMKVR